MKIIVPKFAFWSIMTGIVALGVAVTNMPSRELAPEEVALVQAAILEPPNDSLTERCVGLLADFDANFWLLGNALDVYGEHDKQTLDYASQVIILAGAVAGGQCKDVFPSRLEDGSNEMKAFLRAQHYFQMKLPPQTTTRIGDAGRSFL